MPLVRRMIQIALSIVVMIGLVTVASSATASAAPSLFSSPTVVTTPGGRQALFAVGDGAMWHNWQNSPNSGWHGWISLGAPGGRTLTSTAPVAITNQDGRLEIFALADDGVIWHLWQLCVNCNWNNAWVSLGMKMKTGEFAVVMDAQGRLVVFAVGPDSAVWHTWQNCAGCGATSNWMSLGGTVRFPQTGVDAALNRFGALEVFVLGTDNAVWRKEQQCSACPWYAWASLGGDFGAIPEVMVANGGYLALFATTINVFHKWQTSNGWSDGWLDIGPPPTLNPVNAAAPRVVRNADGRLQAFIINKGGTPRSTWQTCAGCGWGGWFYVGDPNTAGWLNGRIAVGMNQDGRLEAFAYMPHFGMRHAWQTCVGCGWSDWVRL